MLLRDGSLGGLRGGMVGSIVIAGVGCVRCVQVYRSYYDLDLAFGLTSGHHVLSRFQLGGFCDGGPVRLVIFYLMCIHRSTNAGFSWCLVTFYCSRSHFWRTFASSTGNSAGAVTVLSLPPLQFTSLVDVLPFSSESMSISRVVSLD